jgi:GH15 family glucan-1,4-alpha-glucosidase
MTVRGANVDAVQTGLDPCRFRLGHLPAAGSGRLAEPRTASIRQAHMDVSDYAAIGDCRTVALVSKQGAIDWLCLPNPSSPSYFGALLDSERGGMLSIRPQNLIWTERNYIDGTNVLQTTFHCAHGTLDVTDFITLETSEQQRHGLRPAHELIRLLDCTEGEISAEITYQPRPGYARHLPRLVNRHRLGWMCHCDGLGAFLQSDFDLNLAGESTLQANVKLQIGERRQLAFSVCENDIGVLLPLEQEATDRLNATTKWWKDWSEQCTYEGPYRKQVIRSCLALKLLTFSLSGAVLAAPTTSLPIGATGERNWDYRYCWLRDSSLVLEAFMQLGFQEESRAFLGWLLHATAQTQPRLQVMYDVYGRTGLTERELHYLRGHNGVGPVRIGNGAHSQLQLDIYGEVICAAAAFVAAGGMLDKTERKLLVGLGGVVCSLWRKPDQGIWEARSAPRHYTYSKVMCWVALDRLLEIHGILSFDANVEAWVRERDLIREDIEKNAFDADLNAYVAYYGSKQPDASLLLLARHGYVAADDPRMVGTCSFIEKHLRTQALLYRYPPDPNADGVGGAEGFFALCSFWLVDYLSLAGQRARAVGFFEQLLGLANDVGLYAEEFSPHDYSLRGNFPQAFTHIGLITAALSLARREREGERCGNGSLNAA